MSSGSYTPISGYSSRIQRKYNEESDKKTNKKYKPKYGPGPRSGRGYSSSDSSDEDDYMSGPGVIMRSGYGNLSAKVVTREDIYGSGCGCSKMPEPGIDYISNYKPGSQLVKSGKGADDVQDKVSNIHYYYITSTGEKFEVSSEEAKQLPKDMVIIIRSSDAETDTELELEIKSGFGSKSSSESSSESSSNSESSSESD